MPSSGGTRSWPHGSATLRAWPSWTRRGSGSPGASGRSPRVSTVRVAPGVGEGCALTEDARRAWLGGCTAFDGCSGRAALLDRTSALLTALTTIADAAASVSSKDLEHIVPSPGSATSFGAMLPLPPPSPGPDVTTASVQAQLASFEGRVDALQAALATLEARNQPPPASQRLWIPATLAVVGGYYATQALSAHKVRFVCDAGIKRTKAGGLG